MESIPLRLTLSAVVVDNSPEVQCYVLACGLGCCSLELQALVDQRQADYFRPFWFWLVTGCPVVCVRDPVVCDVSQLIAPCAAGSPALLFGELIPTFRPPAASV